MKSPIETKKIADLTRFDWLLINLRNHAERGAVERKRMAEACLASPAEAHYRIRWSDETFDLIALETLAVMLLDSFKEDLTEGTTGDVEGAQWELARRRLLYIEARLTAWRPSRSSGHMSRVMEEADFNALHIVADLIRNAILAQEKETGNGKH
jgi:hypothetical protein